MSSWQWVTRTWWPALRPPPKLTVSEWADRERRLSPEASAEPGRWDTGRAEYQRGILDAISDRHVETVVVMSSAQVGKTELLLNAIGYHVDQDPCPMLVLQPTEAMANAFSKDRLAPMVRDTPALKGKIADAKSRNSGNTVLHKSFPGGHVTIAGAHSPSQLASRPIRKVFLDEVDRYEASAGTEGDPVMLAVKRTTTFWNWQAILTSTPTVKGRSRIEKAYERSDQRQFWVSCPHCDARQVLDWSGVWWPKDDDADGDERHRPGEAAYRCSDCGTLWSDEERWGAIRHGEWVSRRPFEGIAGFHLNEIYSPWVRLSDLVRRFLDARRDPEMLKAWTNTALGQTWEEAGEKLAEGDLAALYQAYGPEDLPDDVLTITAGVDVQGDRLEVELVGWGPEERSWGVLYRVIDGDPSQTMVWEDLDELLRSEFTTDVGRHVRVSAACIDTGYLSEAVLRFCRPRFGRRVYGIKSLPGDGHPIWPLRALKSKTRDRLFAVGAHAAKDAIHARWQIEMGAPASCALPTAPDAGYDAKWLKGVTVEKRVTRYRHGRPYTVWECPEGARNEPLDCRVYALAAFKALPERMRKRSRPSAEKQEAASPPPAQNDFLNGRADWLGAGQDWLRR